MLRRPSILTYLLFLLVSEPSLAVDPTASRSSRASLSIDSDGGANGALRLLAKAETWLQAGDLTKAATELERLETEGELSDGERQLRAWLAFEMQDFGSVVELLEGFAETDEEQFLLAASQARFTGDEGGIHWLERLWWLSPSTVWGVWAVRELAQLEGFRDLYTKSERKLLWAAIPPPKYRLKARGDTIARRSLGRLSKTRRPLRRLKAELSNAQARRYSFQEDWPRAMRLYELARKRAFNQRFRRAVMINVGLVRRQRGIYRGALKNFDLAIDARADDLARIAMAQAGQTAVEYRLYDKALDYFHMQLLTDPLGPYREDALWGLGWVNYRRGNFREARQFFLALLEMEPFGQKAAASVYWAGRCAQELGDLGIAAGEWTMLMRRFPVSYYAHRASEGLAKLSPRIVALKADLPVEDEDDRVGMIGELVAAGLHDKALKHMRQLVPSARENAGPRTLEKLNHMALNIGARYLAAKFRGIRNRRFPRPDQTTIRTLAANFPRSFLGLIDREASKRRLEEPLVVALVRQESGFNSRAISPMGAMGLMQLMPQTAAGLLGRAHAEKSVNPEEILRPSTNVRLGCRYLSRLLKMFGNVDEFALAAYNAGPRAVNRWRRRGDSTVEVFVEEIPYDETRDYVKKVLSWKRKYEYLQGLRSKRAKRATGVAKVLGQPG